MSAEIDPDLDPPEDAPAAWLDVRRGRWWTGACVPGAVSVAAGELRFSIVERRHERRERLAIARLGDDRALAQALGREPLVIRIPLTGENLSFPSVPMLGRTTIRARREGHPDIVLKFLDPGDSSAGPFGLLLRVLLRGPAARRQRDAVRDEIRRHTVASQPGAATADADEPSA